jgi:3',5'-cyclic AMP phosphodiesterase CpdA
MPQLWIFSDLHQDWADNAWDPPAHVPKGGFDVVVVAGDLHTPLTKGLDWLGDRFAGANVVYVPGNHEFWWDRGDDRYTIDDLQSRARDQAAKVGVHLLLDNSVDLAGVRFVGGTLWTNQRLGAISLADAVWTSGKRMNDYRRIRRKASGRHKYVRPIDTIALHRRTLAFLDDVLAQPSALPTAVITHHAPHPGSLPKNQDLPWCDASDLSDLILKRQPALWAHGHVHTRSDYRVGATRVVCNPRGHADEPSSKAFDPSFVVDLSSSDGSA